MLGGGMMMLVPFIPVSYQFWLIGLIIILLVFGTMGYSLMIYLKDEKNGNNK